MQDVVLAATFILLPFALPALMGLDLWLLHWWLG